jgi:amidase
VRAAQGPAVGEGWGGCTIDGVLTRTVRDAAGILDVISARQPGEPYYAPPWLRPLRAEVGADPGQLRIGMLDRPGAEGYLDDPQCRAAVSGAARLLESLGHHVAESAPEAMFEEEVAQHFTNIIAADTEAALRFFEAMLGRPIGEDEIEPRTAFYRLTGAAMDAVTYLQTKAWIAMWARRMASWWAGYDLLLAPTVGRAPARARLVYRGGTRGRTAADHVPLRQRTVLEPGDQAQPAVRRDGTNAKRRQQLRGLVLGFGLVGFGLFG